MTFGEYIRSIRKDRRKSLRKTAEALGVSATYLSDVERGSTCACTAERLGILKDFLEMTTEEANQMYDKAAQSYSNKRGNTTIPQDIASYIVSRDYVVSALRLLKEENADEQDWENMMKAFFLGRKKR